MNNKPIKCLFYFFFLIQLNTMQAGIVWQNKEYIKKSILYVWPLTKIFFGITQGMFQLDYHLTYLKKLNEHYEHNDHSKSFLDYCGPIFQNVFTLNPSKLTAGFGRHIAQYATAFLAIKSGLADLQSLRNKK